MYLLQPTVTVKSYRGGGGGGRGGSDLCRCQACHHIMYLLQLTVTVRSSVRGGGGGVVVTCAGVRPAITLCTYYSSLSLSGLQGEGGSDLCRCQACHHVVYLLQLTVTVKSSVGGGGVVTCARVRSAITLCTYYSSLSLSGLQGGGGWGGGSDLYRCQVCHHIMYLLQLTVTVRSSGGRGVGGW